MRARGYAISIYFLWVPDVSISIERIRDRVAKGGHDVPEVLVRRRFARSIRNFLQIYSATADSWILFDNSNEPPLAIARKEESKTHIIEGRLFEDLSATYGHK
jgi:predicted ABC-type ATPase